MKPVLDILFAILSKLAWPVRWGRRVYLLWRELRTHEQEIDTVRDLIVRELRQNEAVSERRYVDNVGITAVMKGIRTETWDQHAHRWSALRRKNVGLWNEIADAYEVLKNTRTRGSEPPPRGHLAALADRLEEAKI